MILLQQPIQRNYTANVKKLVDMFNSFHLSSNPQKVWFYLLSNEL